MSKTTLTPSEIGRKAAEARWGPPRRVNLADLDPDERLAVLAVVAARRAAKARRSDNAA